MVFVETMRGQHKEVKCKYDYNVLNMCNFQNEVRDRVVLLENVVNSNPTLMERLDTLERRMQEVTVRQSQTLLLPT